MKAPRGLSEAEAEAWAKLAASVTPLDRARAQRVVAAGAPPQPTTAKVAAPSPQIRPFTVGSRRAEGEARQTRPLAAPTPRAADEGNLDSHWERRLSRAALAPDFTLDLHGHTLDQAHARLDQGISQAKAMGARLVLVVTGKSRPVDAADRGSRRGAIRAKILDWLAAGTHASDIAAIRKAHRRHGGEGAIYIVLKRRR